MNGYITIGNLATELKTSNQKLGQIINKLELKTRNIREGKWYSKCLALEDVDKVMAVIDDFQVDQTGRKGKASPEKAVEVVGCNSDKLFREPIVSVDLKSGVTGGQGIWAYWRKESCEILEG